METPGNSYNHLQLTIDFLRALENRQSGVDIERFYHDDVQHTEYPNAIRRNLTLSSLDDLKQASEKGRQVLRKEAYEIVKSYVFGNSVIIEAAWTGTLAIPLGTLKAGDEMKAYFAQFFEYLDGKIIRQRNYDCFEPFT
jgi:hypothetical protein